MAFDAESCQAAIAPIDRKPAWLTGHEWRLRTRYCGATNAPVADLPTDMPALEITAPGGPEMLRLVRRPVPRPGAEEILVRVAAAGVNRPDILQRRGKYPPPPGVTDIPGLDVAGTVAAVGAAVDRWRDGDAVCALVAGGGYAGYCAVPALQALPIPGGLGFVEAAALPETFFTVWTNVFRQARLQPGERLLVHGGSGGVGTTAIQLATAFGAEVYATTGAAWKCDRCTELGARFTANTSAVSFDGAILEATNGEGVDVILDCLGGGGFARNLSLLRPGGRMAVIGLLEGSRAEADLALLVSRRLAVFGSTLRTRTVAEKGAIAADLEADVWPLLAAGKVAPVIDGTYPLQEGHAAHSRMESRSHFGKIVLSVSA
jgi:NADPH2:quinone reductase